MMHEFSLIGNLVKKLNLIESEQRGRKIVGIKVLLGALSHISQEHFREHFEHAKKGMPFENASLEVEVSTDEKDPHASDIILKSVDLEDKHDN
ncbi:MAG: hydrogenase maturation nickel metallochaperone HypA [Candidatus Omnitrophica bacterium]|nr:hydrogenase maturation nickel metallochaperone HypA [Candidatus Omnitrophota bacterium]